MKTALITGGSRGLGKSAAIYLAKAGWDVVITFQSREDLAQETVAEVRALGRKAVALRLDTGVPAGFAQFTDGFRQVLECDFGRSHFDALVNNAGNSSNVPFAETSEADFDALMNVHLKGVFFLTQSLLPLLADGGSILNVSSALARASVPGKSAYAMMKGGVEVLTRYLAKELGPRRIRANTLAPGAIATDFSGGAVRDNPQVSAFVAANTALGRVGQPEDIGGAVAALLAPESGWVNGQVIEASGGMFL
ncbi:SDR family oxidoreductase [Pseudoduganella sp. FT55W]|uniref:SDR family oxidoreductase n=1 Tax=Duganella rivi TaxID=2666083 RepID=A0A7X4KCT8_9BURK|nr:SDR family oxidoreductase [Duganella rivi]MYM67673.1 SDR family oxidoreductase [Duganella rivi]